MTPSIRSSAPARERHKPGSGLFSAPGEMPGAPKTCYSDGITSIWTPDSDEVMSSVPGCFSESSTMSIFSGPGTLLILTNDTNTLSGFRSYTAPVATSNREPRNRKTIQLKWLEIYTCSDV